MAASRGVFRSVAAKKLEREPCVYEKKRRIWDTFRRLDCEAKDSICFINDFITDFLWNEKTVTPYLSSLTVFWSKWPPGFALTAFFPGEYLVKYFKLKPQNLPEDGGLCHVSDSSVKSVTVFWSDTVFWFHRAVYVFILFQRKVDDRRWTGTEHGT